MKTLIRKHNHHLSTDTLFKINKNLITYNNRHLNTLVNKRKILIAYDVDLTILNGNCFLQSIEKLVPNTKERIKRLLLEVPSGKQQNYAKITEDLLRIVKDEGFNLDDLKKAALDIDMTEGFPELFQFLREFKSPKVESIENVILTASNSIYIKWIVEHFKIEDLFPSNLTLEGYLNEDTLIAVKEAHKHNCQLCDASQCKAKALKDFIEDKYGPRKDIENLNVNFVGDGFNDYCVGRFLQEDDTFFVRKGYELDKIITNRKKEGSFDWNCKVKFWENGKQIKDMLTLI